MGTYSEFSKERFEAADAAGRESLSEALQVAIQTDIEAALTQVFGDVATALRSEGHNLVPEKPWVEGEFAYVDSDGARTRLRLGFDLVISTGYRDRPESVVGGTDTVLDIDAFRIELDARRHGHVLALPLATVQPIAAKFGIASTARVAASAGEFVASLCPPGVTVGFVDWCTVAVLGDVSLEDLARSVVARAPETDVEVEPGEWAELRFAAGSSEIGEPGGPTEALTTAMARARDDFHARFPREWWYPEPSPE